MVRRMETKIELMNKTERLFKCCQVKSQQQKPNNHSENHTVRCCRRRAMLCILHSAASAQSKLCCT